MIQRILVRLYSKKLREKFYELYDYLDIKVERERLLGFLILCSIGLAAFLSFVLKKLYPLINKINYFILFFALLIFFIIMIYTYLTLAVDKKSKYIEEILPDVLQLMSSNLRAGLTTDKALILSGRPEFGVFKDEINRVGKEITMGKEIDEALLGMAKRVRSRKLKKSVVLIVSGLKSGGELASLLDQTARNLRQEKFVDEKIRSNVMMYVVFIFSAIGIGAPMLFGLSSFLVEVMTKSLGSIEIPQTTVAAAIPLKFNKVNVSVDFVNMFAVISLITNSILGSFILGSISKGKEKEGIKYAPILIIISLVIFYVVKNVIRTMLGGMFDF